MYVTVYYDIGNTTHTFPWTVIYGRFNHLIFGNTTVINPRTNTIHVIHLSWSYTHNVYGNHT